MGALFEKKSFFKFDIFSFYNKITEFQPINIELKTLSRELSEIIISTESVIASMYSLILSPEIKEE